MLLDIENKSILTAICVIIKGLAIACFGQKLATAEASKDIGVCHYVESASNRSVAVTCPERSTRQLHSRGTGRASRVNAKTWTAELEIIVDSSLKYRLANYRHKVIRW